MAILQKKFHRLGKCYDKNQSCKKEEAFYEFI